MLVYRQQKEIATCERRIYIIYTLIRTAMENTVGVFKGAGTAYHFSTPKFTIGFLNCGSTLFIDIFRF